MLFIILYENLSQNLSYLIGKLLQAAPRIAMYGTSTERQNWLQASDYEGYSL